MKKIGIVVDSSCGLTEAEAKNKGWGYLPLILTIDNNDYRDGVDLTPTGYYSRISIRNNTKTAATSPAIIEDVVKGMLNDFENIIIYSLSSGLSSQNANIRTITADFNNVHVVESQAIGIGIISDCNNIESFGQDHTIEETLEYADSIRKLQYGLVIPETMDWLVKGGRASKSAASLANLLKIVPIIKFENGKLDKFGKGRVFKKTFIKISKVMASKVDENTQVVILHADNHKISSFVDLFKVTTGIQNVLVELFPSIITNHIGLGAIAILIFKK